MEVKPGYKQTEVGVIPEDWDVFSIEKICSRITDGEHLTPKRAENGIYLLSARNVHNGFLLLDDVDFFLESEYQKFKKRVNPEMGDLLISCSGTIGRVCVVPDNFLFGLVRSVAIIKPIKEHIDSNYLMFLFQFDTVQKQIQKSLNQLAQANLFQGQIRQLIIPCPIKKEQTAIATALSDVDALISGLDRLIEKKRAIKQAAMQELLTGKRRLPGFNGEWEIKNFGEIGECIIGLTYKPENIREYGVLVLRSSNIHHGLLKFEDNVYVETEIPDKLYLKKGDIVICVRNGSRDLIGKCALIDQNLEGMTFGAFMSVFRTQYANFIFHQFQSDLIKKQIQEHLGATINQITNKSLKSFKIHFPTDDQERDAIATVLSDMDAEISALETRRAKTISLKQGMMQELLTGRIRLV